MSKTFRPYDPEQMFLLPASLQDWLPKGHLAYFVLRVSTMVEDLPQIVELDLNPVKVLDQGSGCVVVAARVLLR